MLTPREWEVLDLLREGLTNEQIAERLEISRDTAKFHVSEILTKLGVESRRDAAAWRGRPRVALGLAPGAALLKQASAVSPWKLAGGGAIAAAGVLLVLLGLGVLMSNGPESLGKIAFVRDGDIWVQELPDGTPHQLTHQGGAAMPRWSPSGEWLLYTRHDPAMPARPEAWVIRSDGAAQRLLEGHGYSTSWVIDWRTLPAGHEERLSLDTSSDLVAFITPEGSNIVEQPDGQNGTVLSAPFLQDGARVLRHHYGAFSGIPSVYIEERYRIDPSTGDEDPRRIYQGIWVTSADGEDRREIVAADTEQGEQLLPVGIWPELSYLLLAALPEDVGDHIQDGLPLQAVPIDGSGPVDLDLIHALGLGGSPHGDSLVIVAGDRRETWTNKRLARIAPDGTSYTLLTEPDVAAISPAWSPDGRHIAYTAAPDLGPEARDQALSSRRIWLMDADGGDQRQLTDGEGFRDDSPMWSADGRHILFARLSADDFCDTDAYDLMVYSVESGAIQRLAEGLPLLGTYNERPVVGEVPECDPTTSHAFTTDMYGRLNLAAVMDWWQPEP